MNTWLQVLDPAEARKLAEQAKRGDDAAFGELIRDRDHDCRGLVWAIVQSGGAIEDLMESSYEMAFRAIRSFDGRSSFSVWLLAICYRSAMDHVLSEDRRRHEEPEMPASSGAFARLTAPASAVEQADAPMVIDDVFEGAGVEQRALLMLSFGLGYDVDEVSEIVDLKRGSVAANLTQARADVAAAGDEFDEALGKELRWQIPHPMPGDWIRVDERLENIDPSDAAAAAVSAGVSPSRVVEPGDEPGLNSNGRLLLAIAAVVAVLGLGALLLNRGESDGEQLDVAAAGEVTPEPGGATDSEGAVVPVPVAVRGETPLQALRARLAGQVDGVGEEGAGSAGPFCFENEAAAIFPGDDALSVRSIVWLDISFDGFVNAFAYQPNGGPALISGSAQGTESGVFDMNFVVESGGDGALPAYSVALNDSSFALGSASPFTAVSCEDIAFEVQGLFQELNVPAVDDIEPAIDENIEGVEFLPDEAPVVWRFKSGPVNYRAQPTLQGEIIGEWAGDEVGIAGTGKRARADGYEWVQFAAGEGRASGWVAQNFIEPDPDVVGRVCYRTGQTAMVLDFKDDAESFVGGIRSDVPEGVEYVAVAGRRFDGTLFDVRSQKVGSQLVNAEEWGAFSDGISGNVGLLSVTECDAMPETVTEITTNVTVYPALPA